MGTTGRRSGRLDACFDDSAVYAAFAEVTGSAPPLHLGKKISAALQHLLLGVLAVADQLDESRITHVAHPFTGSESGNRKESECHKRSESLVTINDALIRVTVEGSGYVARLQNAIQVSVLPFRSNAQ